jgi:PmbA protein
MSDSDHEKILGDLLRAAKAAGADAADAVYGETVSSNISIRLGAVENTNRAEGKKLGLRVIVGGRVAFVATGDVSRDAMMEMAANAVAMARSAPVDEFAGLAPQALLAKAVPALDLEDAAEPATERLIALARASEAAAMAVPGVTNSSGANTGFSRSKTSFATSNGFYGAYAGTNFGMSVAVLAGGGAGMETDGDQTSARHMADLEAPEILGNRAGTRAVSRLNPRMVASQAVPVVFDSRVSPRLLGHFAAAITGAAVARGVSFLKDKMDAPVFSPGVTIIDDPHRCRGLNSRPFDGDGVQNRRMVLVEDGRLKTWLLDCSAARQLGLETTGHAVRGISGPPGAAASNLTMEPGAVTPAELIGQIREGFYVTTLIGHGVNGVTGDYSLGAAGFWIVNGEIAFPVSGITIAGNLKDMFRNLTPANDLVLKRGMDAPTVRIDGMTVAGR